MGRRGKYSISLSIQRISNSIHIVGKSPAQLADADFLVIRQRDLAAPVAPEAPLDARHHVGVLVQDRPVIAELGHVTEFLVWGQYPGRGRGWSLARDRK